MSRRALLLVSSAALVVGAASFCGDAGAGAPPSDARESVRVELGRRLFFDPALGREGRIGCASCHDPEHGFSDPRVRSVDEAGELPRHSQPLTDLAGEGFHWDGEFDTVADVVRARVLPRAEAITASAERSLRRVTTSAKLPAQFDADAARIVLQELSAGGSYYGDLRLSRLPGDPVTIAARIASGDAYADGFRRAFGDPAVTSQRIVDAVDAYLRSLRTAENALDRFLAGDSLALTESARRGLDLFRGRARCAECHMIDGSRPALSDGKFHDTGVAGGGAGGRRARTFQASHAAAFKTPSLRDVARRAPYMHDGSLATLTDVVRYYDTGGRGKDDMYLDSRICPLSLSDREVADLVAFLESLSGTTRAGLGEPMPWRPQRFVVRAETPDGKAAPHKVIRVRPFGDRLANAAQFPPAFDVVTDANGEASFPFPATTHVSVEAEGFASPRILPDWTSRVRLLVPSSTRVTLRACFAAGSTWRPDVIRVYPGWRTRWADVLHFQKVADSGPDVLYEADAPAANRGPAECELGVTVAGEGFPRSTVVDLSPGACTTISLPATTTMRDASAIERANEAARALADAVRIATPR